MRTTIEILVDLEDGKMPPYEELRMACLVQKTLMFFVRKNIANLLKDGIAADLVRKKFSNKYAKLGTSKDEHNALHMDPLKYLNPQYIPGTPEWEKTHKVYAKILDKFCNKDKGTS